MEPNHKDATNVPSKYTTPDGFRSENLLLTDTATLTNSQHERKNTFGSQQQLIGAQVEFNSPQMQQSNQATAEFNPSLPVSPAQMSPEDSKKKSKHAKKLSIIIDEEIEMKGGDINSPALHSNKSKPTNPAKSSEFKNGMVN